MGFYEDKRDGTVKNSMAKYGMAMVLVVPSAGTYTASTGQWVAGVEATYTVQGLVGSYRKGRKSGTAVSAKTRYIYLSPSGMTVVPTPNHKLRVSDVEYEIVDVEEISPAGVTVLYQLEVRQP